MKNFNTQEIARAEEIISAGLQKAAESLSFFMKETITLQESGFQISDEFNTATPDETSEQLYILSTELMGQLKGVCYLVFSEEESNEICKVALPESVYNDPEKLKGMKEPLLLEVDNILSASVITQLANHLKLKVYGDVPYLNVMDSAALKQLIIQQMQPDKLVMGFQTEFISSKNHFHPSFLWILEPDFLHCVQQTLLAKAD